MSMPIPFFDVALSFRVDDEPHAEQLHDLLRDRLDVFIYSKYQDLLVSTDGEESFGHIFRDRARVVVIFYRPSWGTTMMTRAEQSAIKQRAATEGYGFTVWVPMGEHKQVPPYIDPQFIWFYFDRYGIDGLALAVEERVRASGRDVRPPSFLDELRTGARKRDIFERRASYRFSVAASEQFRRDFDRIGEIIRHRADAYQEADPRIVLKCESTPHGWEAIAWPHRLVIAAHGLATNSVEDARISFVHQRRNDGEPFVGDWKEVAHGNVSLTLDEAGQPAWQKGHDSDMLTFEEVVHYFVDHLARLRSREALKDAGGR